MARIERGYYYFSELSISGQLIKSTRLAGARQISLTSRIFTSEVIARADSNPSDGKSRFNWFNLFATKCSPRRSRERSSIAGPATLSILQRTAVYLRSGEGTDDC